MSSKKSFEYYKMLLLYCDPDKGQVAIFKYKAFFPLKLRADQLTYTLKMKEPMLICFIISLPKDFRFFELVLKITETEKI